MTLVSEVIGLLGSVGSIKEYKDFKIWNNYSLCYEMVVSIGVKGQNVLV